MKSQINFFTEEIKFVLKDKTKIRKWVFDSALAEGYRVGELSFIFCTDDYLSTLNAQYLKHTSLTDVITFDYSEKQIISGDIFISIERVRENAIKFKVVEDEELRRVIIHGVLHLCGYKDDAAEKQKEMCEKENELLYNYNNIN